MPKIQRLDANGNLFVQGNFDEISGTRIREFANGDLFAKEFDEIATELDSSNTIRRILADGSILIKGFFDEVTKLEAAGGGGGGDTNLQFNVTAGTLSTGSLGLDHEFSATGGVSSPTSAGNGTWYNGTPTGSNFEMQIVVNSLTVAMLVTLEGDTFSSPGTSSWYTLSSTRIVTCSDEGTANVTVKIREIATPSNMITQNFDYEIVP